jgi:hypothetical protein
MKNDNEVENRLPDDGVAEDFDDVLAPVKNLLSLLEEKKRSSEIVGLTWEVGQKRAAKGDAEDEWILLEKARDRARCEGCGASSRLTQRRGWPTGRVEGVIMCVHKVLYNLQSPSAPRDAMRCGYTVSKCRGRWLCELQVAKLESSKLSTFELEIRVGFLDDHH